MDTKGHCFPESIIIQAVYLKLRLLLIQIKKGFACKLRANPFLKSLKSSRGEKIRTSDPSPPRRYLKSRIKYVSYSSLAFQNSNIFCAANCSSTFMYLRKFLSVLWPLIFIMNKVGVPLRYSFVQKDLLQV